jgi:signal transduction histidine kinase
MSTQAVTSGRIATLLCGGVVLLGLYLAKLYNYLLFHTLVEIFSVVVACGIFTIAWNARRIMDNNYFLLVGIASLCVGSIDLLHTMAYKGMGVFPGYGPDLATQLWIAARYLQSFALLVAPFFLGRTLKAGWTISAFGAATALLLAAIFTGNFPACFVEGVGLTPFKIGSEYLVCLLLLGALFFLHKKMAAFDQGVVRLLSSAIVAFIAAELAFTLYSDVYGISNMIGHFLKVAGFYCVYKALIETALARPYDLLFRELATKAAALKEANVELEAFSHTVSHDLRAPLTNISGSCQVLTTLCGDQLDAEGQRFLGYIHDETQRMDTLITTLLKFSQLNRQELHREEVDLSNLATAIVTGLRMREPERQVACTIAADVTGFADPLLLSAVMENLLGNAWKYTGKTEAARIEFGVTEAAGKPAFFVRDNGAGFDMKEAHKLFDAFQRLHSRSEFEGTGIGLTTVQRIIQRHGGQVWAEGEVGRGATFFFTL